VAERARQACRHGQGLRLLSASEGRHRLQGRRERSGAPRFDFHPFDASLIAMLMLVVYLAFMYYRGLGVAADKETGMRLFLEAHKKLGIGPTARTRSRTITGTPL